MTPFNNEFSKFIFATQLKKKDPSETVSGKSIITFSNFVKSAIKDFNR